MNSIAQEIQKIRQRVEAIEAAIMRTSDLLNVMVLDLRKAQTLLSLPDERCDFTLKSERKMQ